MLYKEWRVIRFRFFLAIAVFIGMGAWTLIYWKPTPKCQSTPDGTYVCTSSYLDTLSFNSTWLLYGLFLTVGFGILLSADLISEEQNNGTLTFVLCRPISRATVYAAKIAARVVALLVMQSFVFISLLILGPIFKNSSPDNLPNELTLTLALMALGVWLVCLSGVISIFTTNAIQTILITVLVVLSLILFLKMFQISLEKPWRFNIPFFNQTTLIENIVVTVLFSGITISLFLAGQRVFNAREY